MIEYITLHTFKSFWSQVYRDEKVKLYSKVFHKPLEVPWMRTREIDFMSDLLIKLKPKSCLEWGAGYSSAYFTQSFKHDFKWISIEHDKEWAKYAQSKVTNPNIEVHHIPANNLSHHIGINDGTYDDYKDYIEFPLQFGPFDFIFIDGRARTECLKKALTLLSETGVIVLHDSNRFEYQQTCKTIDKGHFFLDNRTTSGGIWIKTGSKISLSDLIDVNHFIKLFNIYTSVGKYIKI